MIQNVVSIFTETVNSFEILALFEIVQIVSVNHGTFFSQ